MINAAGVEHRLWLHQKVEKLLDCSALKSNYENQVNVKIITKRGEDIE